MVGRPAEQIEICKSKTKNLEIHVLARLPPRVAAFVGQLSQLSWVFAYLIKPYVLKKVYQDFAEAEASLLSKPMAAPQSSGSSSGVSCSSDSCMSGLGGLIFFPKIRWPPRSHLPQGRQFWSQIDRLGRVPGGRWYLASPTEHYVCLMNSSFFPKKQLPRTVRIATWPESKLLGVKEC